MTNFGELESLREGIKMLGTIEAELKLVIAGNYDISLNKENRVENMSDEEYTKWHEAALDILTGSSAKEADVTYLEEGTHKFALSNGAMFNVYASPYTPGSAGWAFPYETFEDRSNNANQLQKTEHLSPQVLSPRVSTSYHIHEGHGANIVTWMPDGSAKDPSSATPMETEQVNEYPYTNEWSIQSGKQTLMVNAAIMMNTANGMQPNYNPFIISLNLPCQ